MTELYLLDCKSNMHVGSGDSNYGVIDKQVQRDTTDDLPCIYASSLKGAFREFFEENLKNMPKEARKTLADQIFGGGENKSSQGMVKGTYQFDQAMLFSIPVRSNKRPFFNAIAPSVATKLLNRIELSGIKSSNDFIQSLQKLKNIPENTKPIIVNFNSDKLQIEGFESFEITTEKYEGLTGYLGEMFVILSDADFMEITNDYHLPIIARNKLDNGESKNLWYEQVLSRETKFTFFVDCNDSSNALFKNNVDGKQVQIGGGSSIGYGNTKVQNIQL